MPTATAVVVVGARREKRRTNMLYLVLEKRTMITKNAKNDTKKICLFLPGNEESARALGALDLDG